MRLPSPHPAAGDAGLQLLDGDRQPIHPSGCCIRHSHLQCSQPDPQKVHAALPVRINLTPEARQAECSALETARQDNLPNTGLEAHACGTPVVAGLYEQVVQSGVRHGSRAPSLR
jgi:hypothetical protein